jgi:hypothetical protein
MGDRSQQHESCSTIKEDEISQIATGVSVSLRFDESGINI